MQIDGLVLSQVLHADPDTTIWRGTRTADGAPIIVKHASSATPSPAVTARLRHEARSLERLRAVPGVVALLETRETPRGLALVLSDDGLVPLAELASSGPLPLALALRIGAGLARALAELHRRDVVHKDVKPGNVLVSSDGARVELIDFGVASWLGREAARVREGDAVEGTLAYLAPEQTGRTGRAIDARADLYALGVTLYELVAGRRPFEATDPLALLHAHLAVVPTPLDALGTQPVPTLVARLVAKLLEKDPDARYQTATGVAADLARCAEQLARSGEVAPFPLGTQDFVTRVRLPDALVGRDDELRTLDEAYARARAGGRELVLLAGPSGSGKTALARTVQSRAARDGGATFLAGKHEELARSRPYAALADAFGARFANVAAAPTDVVTAFGRRVREALGPNAALLADVMRELTWVTGPLEAVAELGPQEQQNRLALAWRKLARVVRDDAVRDEAGGVLALFLDDVQWADPATLGLLGDLAAELEGALLLVSFRVNEVGPEHSLWPAIERASAQGVRVTRIDVRDLDVTRVGQLLTASLPGAERIEALAELVWRRTGGNPFFVGQLLLALAGRGLVTRDEATGTWRWDLDAIASAPLGDDVVSLVTTRLDDLPAETRRALGVGACAGARFDLRGVAAILEVTPAVAAQALWPAVQLGVIAAEDGRLRAVLDGSSTHDEVGLRFTHDRVQEAAWARLDDEARARTHLALARRLAGELDGAARFERARHEIAALPVIDDPEDRAAVVAHCLDAAAAARRAGAFDAMDRFVRGAAAASVGASDDPARAVAVATLEVQCDVLMRRFERAEERATELLRGALPMAARLGLHALRLQIALIQGDLPRGTQVAREALAEVGRGVPDAEAMLPELTGAIGRVLALGPTLFEGDASAWLSEPFGEVEAMTDQLVLQGALCAALGGAPLLGAYWIASAVDVLLTARRATPVAPMLVVCFGQVLSTTTTDYAGPTRWIHFGAALAERLRSPVQADCAVQAGHVMPHHESVERTVAWYERAIALGFEQGAFGAISWGTTGAIVYGHAWRGEALASLRERLARARVVVERAGDVPGRDLARSTEAWLDALAGGVSEPPTEERDVLAFGPRELLRDGNGNAAAIMRVYECHARYAYGLYPEALACAEEAEAQRTSMFAVVTVTDIDLWLGLSAARVASTLEGDRRAERVALVARSAARFAAYGERSAENFEHKRLLLQGELAHLEGRPLEALALFDRAAATAKATGFVFVRGIALERAGELSREAGLELGARTYLEAARDVYAGLGADGLAAAVARRHGLGATRTVVARDSASSSTVHLRSDDFDLATVLRAAEALGAERDPRGVVARLMEKVVGSAGAERGVLVLAREHGWEIAARHGAAIDDVGARVELDAVEGAAVAALRYVARTRERVVAPHAALDPRFAEDPRVASGVAGSLVAAPLLHRGELVGVLYLEHGVPGSFAASRAALLEMLAGLGAVAWENARLVSGLEAARDALQQANEGLERQVAARTAALDRALAELWTEMDLATRIQTVLLPEDGARGPYDVAAVMRPAERVGGDYYDVFEHAGHLWVLVGDVSGHGVNAGLVMMMVQASVRAVVRALDGAVPLAPARLLATVNAALRHGLGRIGRGQYMTITALRLDADGAVVHAGLHQDVLVRRADTGFVEQVPSKGLWIGLVDDLTPFLVDTPLTLAPGDALVLYSDGVTESRKERSLLGHAPLVEAIERCGDARPAEVVDAILALLEGREVDDDVTVLCLRRD
jgi:serine phosphatase RsbU (regulator of sigma subunit)